MRGQHDQSFSPTAKEQSKTDKLRDAIQEYLHEPAKIQA
jgi:hypothetical protein